MIRVIIRAAVSPGQQRDFLEYTRALIDKSSTQPGCIEYEMMVDAPVSMSQALPHDDNAITHFEKWDSMEAYVAYFQSDEVQRFIANIKDIATGLEFHFLDVV